MDKDIETAIKHAENWVYQAMYAAAGAEDRNADAKAAEAAFRAAMGRIALVVAPVNVAKFEGHTPGDWQYDVDKGAIYATIWTERSRRFVAEAPLERDGNLIAAAPRLLRELTAARARIAVLTKALQAAEGHLEETLHDPKWHPVGRCPVLELVRATLAGTETTP